MEYSPWASDVPDTMTGQTADSINYVQNRGSGDFEPFSVALIADVHNNFSNLDAAGNYISRRDDVEFTFLVGDFTDNGLLDEYIWTSGIIDTFKQPVFTVIGNHDGLNNGKDIYREMFGPFDYSFVYKTVKFVVWNNNRYEWGRPDFEWLEKQVDTDDDVIIVTHQPPASEALVYSDRVRYSRILESDNIIAVVSAHTHHFKYWTEFGELPFYIVEAIAEGPHFGLMTIEDDGVRFDNCKPQCTFAGKGDR